MMVANYVVPLSTALGVALQRDAIGPRQWPLALAILAASLFVSEATVKSHIGHIFTKLDLRDRAAIVFAFHHGLVVPRG